MTLLSAVTESSCWSLRRGTSTLAAVAIGLAFAAVAGWNAATYPSSAGYDAAQHQQYADLLIHHGEIPGAGTRSE